MVVEFRRQFDAARDPATARNTLGITAANTTSAGILETATDTETRAMSSSSVVLTPSNLTVIVPAHTYTELVTFTSASAAIPLDDTIPLITEGTQIMTAVFTPKTTTNKVNCKADLNCSADTAINVQVALFRDSGTNALAAWTTAIEAAGRTRHIHLTHEETGLSAGVPVTYSVRVGPNTNTAGSVMTLNGTSAARVLGGVAKCTLVVDEIIA